MDYGFTPMGRPGADDGQGSLQPLDWSGLCARLAAEGDLRRALAEPSQAAGMASFAPAVSVAWRGPWPDAPAVNPEPLANGKAPGANGHEDDESRREDLGGHE